jgi:hypothetical protein
MVTVRNLVAGVHVGYCVWIWVALTPLVSASEHDLNFAAAGALLVVTAVAVSAGIRSARWLGRRDDRASGVEVALAAVAVGAVPSLMKAAAPGLVLWLGGGALVALLSLGRGGRPAPPRP